MGLLIQKLLYKALGTAIVGKEWTTATSLDSSREVSVRFAVQVRKCERTSLKIVGTPLPARVLFQNESVTCSCAPSYRKEGRAFVTN